VITAIACVRNEADVIGATVNHLLHHGIDRLLIYDHGSTDDTSAILENLRIISGLNAIRLFRNDEPNFHQAKLTNELANIARAEGATWILPFDADEWWIPKSAGSIREALLAFSEPTIVVAKVFQHRDWNTRAAEAQHLPKMVMTAQPCHIVQGSHLVLSHPGKKIANVLEVRELQFRSEDHYVEKMRERLATLRPDSPDGENVHYKAVRGMNETELRSEYRRGWSRPTVVSPIPSLFEPKERTR